MLKIIASIALYAFFLSNACAQNAHWINKPGMLPTSQDLFYKDGPTEITVSAEIGHTASGRALISFTEWGDAVSCQYGNDGILISNTGRSPPLVSMGCAPQGPKGATFIAQLSIDNMKALRGASKLYFRQGTLELPISTDGLSTALSSMK